MAKSTKERIMRRLTKTNPTLTLNDLANLRSKHADGKQLSPSQSAKRRAARKRAKQSRRMNRRRQK